MCLDHRTPPPPTRLEDRAEMAEKHGISGGEDTSAKRARQGEVDAEPAEAGAAEDSLGVLADPRSVARVGTWVVPEVPEGQEKTNDIALDLSGTEEEIEARLRQTMLQRKAAAAAAAAAAEQVIAVESDIAESSVSAQASSSRQQAHSTTPPPRRARRAAAAVAASTETEDGPNDQGQQTTSPADLTASIAVEKRKVQQLEQELRSTNEHTSLLKTLYDEASRSTVEAESQARKLRLENEQLHKQLKEGLDLVRSFGKDRIQHLEQKLRVTQGQLKLLQDQNALTNDDVRRKAAMWDAQEAEEQEQREMMERRRIKREEERRRLQESILGSDVGGAQSVYTAPKPHEVFLQVDLDEERIDVDEKAALAASAADAQDHIADDDDDDELAALAREAQQNGDVQDTLDVSQPRARRSRKPTGAVTGESALDAARAAAAVEGNDVLIEEAQLQSQLASAENVEDEFAFALASTASHADALADQTGSPSFV